MARRKQKGGKGKSAESLRQEIFFELRSIIRMRHELRLPMQMFLRVEGDPLEGLNTMLPSINRPLLR